MLVSAALSLSACGFETYSDLEVRGIPAFVGPTVKAFGQPNARCPENRGKQFSTEADAWTRYDSDTGTWTEVYVAKSAHCN